MSYCGLVDARINTSEKDLPVPDFISFFKIFLQLSSEVSGRGAKTKIRGRLKDKEEEEKIAKERAELVRKDMEAKYARWNKG